MYSNKIKGGLAGKILRVDLTNERISTENTEKYAIRLLGGRGINDLILLNEMNSETKWSDPENLLCFGVGTLVGTLTPGACRVSVDSKNAFNNGIGSANFGGHFGAELKYAGFDNVVISGKAENPVYLWIQDRKAELRDAKSVWGKTTYDAEEILQKELKDDKIKMAAIGPAGENCVKAAAVVSGRGKVAGGCGMGCVMGVKKLKAIVVRGHGSIKVAEPEMFFKALDTAFKKIRDSPTAEPMRKSTLMGTSLKPEDELWECGGPPVRGGQDNYWPIEKRKKIAGVNKYRKRILACFSCPIGCIPFSEIDTGKYKGTGGPGFWINSVWSWATRLDLDDPEAVLAAHLLTNKLGLDGDNASVVISWAFECFEKGLLTAKETDGLELEWGNENAIIKMIEKLAYREGIGNLLAEGVKEASRRLGKGSEALAVHNKGQDSLDSYRIAKGWALAISTSPVGGRHLRGAIGSSGLSGPKGTTFKPTEYDGQPELVLWQAQAKGVEDMLGICTYVGTWYGAYALEPSDYAALTSSVTGMEMDEKEIMLIGRRLYNLEKAFNTIHAGFGRGDDLPPKRYMEEPVKSGPYKGVKCDREKFERMLDEFYELNGWDVKTGLQTRNGLIELGLEDVAMKLKKAGKLIEK